MAYYFYFFYLHLLISYVLLHLGRDDGRLAWGVRSPDLAKRLSFNSPLPLQLKEWKMQQPAAAGQTGTNSSRAIFKS